MTDGAGTQQGCSHFQMSVPKHSGAEAAEGSAEAQPQLALSGGIFPFQPLFWMRLDSFGAVLTPSSHGGTLPKDPSGQDVSGSFTLGLWRWRVVVTAFSVTKAALVALVDVLKSCRWSPARRVCNARSPG